ncbi:MAG: cation:proton antiporter [Clostridia bacterium]|nr:cation:proton antiporter [Clostridia bacterium]
MFYINNGLGFVAVLAIILFFTKSIGLIFRKLGLPQVLGYIIAGIIIGPAIFGDLCGFTLIGFEGKAYKAMFKLAVDSEGHGFGLEIFSKIGVLFLMFCAGLETNIKDLKNTGLASFLVACAGVAVPLLLGFLISLPFGSLGLGVDNLYRCVFIGTILTATSVAITVSVLKELGKINTKLGTTIVSAAIIDDVIGIVLLSVVTGFAKSDSAPAANGFEAFKATPYGTVIMIIAFFIVGIGLGFLVSKAFRWLDKRWPNKYRLSIYSLVVVFGYSWLAEEIFGVADITGAFLAGIILSTDHRASVYIDKNVDVEASTLFAPVFFANIGISSISFAGMNPAILLFAFVAVIAGIAGKIIGCGAVCKAFKYSWRESAIGGVGMMARGEVALIVTQTVTATALGANALGGEFMLMTVLLILVSSILTPVLLKVLYKGVKEPEHQHLLIDPDD